jgi:hypothetical protein
MSDRSGEVVERLFDPQSGAGVHSELQMSSAQVLDEGMAGARHLRSSISL